MDDEESKSHGFKIMNLITSLFCLKEE